MSDSELRVLAVADPAVRAYVEPGLGILERWRSGGRALTFDIVPWGDYYPTLLAQAERPAYDVAMIAGHLWLRDFAESGAILPLDGYLRELGPAYDDADIAPEIRRDCEWEGRRWLVPSFTDGHLVFYDAAAAASAGCSPAPTIRPRDLVVFARRVSGGGRRAALKAGPSEIFLDWLPYLLAEGAEPFDAEGRPTFDCEAGRRALGLYLEMLSLSVEGSVGFGNEEVLQALASGRALVGTSWGGQAARIVAAASGRRLGFAGFERPWSVAWSFAILSGSRRPREAFELLAYLSSKEVDRAVGRYAGSPTRLSAYADPAERAACPWYPAQLEMVRRAYSLPRLRGSGAIFGVLYEELSRAARGEASPAQALGAAERRVLELRG